jgi:uncharacterized protein
MPAPTVAPVVRKDVLTVKDQIDAADLLGLLDRIRAALAAARDEVNALNVFPVPDGDTGTNLYVTVDSAHRELADAEGSRADLVRAAARGALRGAAGNSGVIFSQVVRAMADQLADVPIDAATLPGVLDRARDLSYDAVAEPLPGTILSAMDAAAEAAWMAEEDLDVVGVLRRVLQAVGVAVAHSRDVLEANRAAGVVDAGARGFEVALDGMLAWLEGRTFDDVVPPPIRRVTGDVVTRESGSLEYGHEVQYLLEADDDVIPDLKAALESLGDSVVVVGCGGLLNVHVHTNDVDDAIEVGRRIGAPSRIHVTAFADQVGPTTEPGAASPGHDVAAPAARRMVGYLAVVPGPGLADLVRAAGAVAVEGAAGDLPTVATVLNAVGDVRADEIVLLPGNPNVVPTMHQASSVSVAEGGRALHVVDAADSPASVLAVLAVAPTDRVDLDTCSDAARDVRSGEVVQAVRDAQTPLGPVRADQFLAVVGGVVVGAHDRAVDAVCDVVESIMDDGVELVTLVVGADVDEDEEVRVKECVAGMAPRAEIEVVQGRQRPARWILGAE